MKKVSLFAISFLRFWERNMLQSYENARVQSSKCRSCLQDKTFELGTR